MLQFRIRINTQSKYQQNLSHTKQVLKCRCNQKRPRIANDPGNKRRTRDITILDFKLCYKATLLERACNGTKTDVNQWNRLQVVETTLRTFSYAIFDQVSTKAHCRKSIYFTQWYQENRLSMCNFPIFLLHFLIFMFLHMKGNIEKSYHILIYFVYYNNTEESYTFQMGCKHMYMDAYSFMSTTRYMVAWFVKSGCHSQQFLPNMELARKTPLDYWF